MRCLIGSQRNFLSIGVMCSNFDVFVTNDTSQSILYALYFVQVSLRNAIVECRVNYNNQVCWRRVNWQAL